ncbi:MAG: endonuclease [Thermotoga sp. 4484_232]|nr:YraN family protein [Thermotogaceae bacterium]OQX58396.1 MAG: endonuclease [Thermotoga sp. 4484_232]RKX53355.1 MAG: endonuclease [Thermotoga sp.]RKX56967.1 MAG: endonuclease [Thermotoga sp.]HDG62098.1 endonuclease [Thermotoga sp.]
MNWKEAEKLAADHLKRKGYRILERNYRTPYGEIDIIAMKGKVLVFVEVKSGSGKRIKPLDRIDRKKIKRMLTTAQFFILNKNFSFRRVRFDVIEVTPSGITHIEEVNF